MLGPALLWEVENGNYEHAPGQRGLEGRPDLGLNDASHSACLPCPRFSGWRELVELDMYLSKIRVLG